MCKQGAQEPKDAELSKRDGHAAGCRLDTGDQAFPNWVLQLGAKKAVLTIGWSFKHAQPRKEPLHGRIRLLGDPPASDAAWGGCPGLCKQRHGGPGTGHRGP